MSDSVRTRRSERILTPFEAGMLAVAVDLALSSEDALEILNGTARALDDEARRMLTGLADDLREASL